jgi:hypothetical protein
MSDWPSFWGALAARRELPRSPWPAPEEVPPSVAREPEAEVLERRLRALGLRGVAGVRATDNRAVMVGLSKVRVLRVHRGYAHAPDRVLRAIVRFVARTTPRLLRRAAQHEILSFRAEAHASGPPRRRRAPDRERPGDAAHVARLLACFRDANAAHFGGLLPELPIRLSGRMRSRLGQLCLSRETGRPFEITVGRRHVERHDWQEVADTLLHEMVHLWQHENGHAVDHGSQFRAKARDVGVAPAARRAVRRAPDVRRAARSD